MRDDRPSKSLVNRFGHVQTFRRSYIRLDARTVWSDEGWRVGENKINERGLARERDAGTICSVKAVRVAYIGLEE